MSNLFTVVAVLLFLSYTHSNTHPMANHSIPAKDALTITSASFKNNEMIPAKFTCEGGSVSPALRIDGMPDGTKGIAIIVDDPDAPAKGGFVHWVAWNIDPTMPDIPEGYK